MPSGVFSLKQLNQALQQGAWTNQKPLNVDYLVVAGGGGGGGASGGGGGAGGLLNGKIAVAAGSAITVTVGSGGAGSTSGNPGNGTNSVFGSITATGGGGGGTSSGTPSIYNALSGGSGGGAGPNGNVTASSGTVGQGVLGQGNTGGGYAGSDFASWTVAGGGGGAGSVGSDAVRGTSGQGGQGGQGVALDISGTRTVYAGGGGGGMNSGTGGTGGAGGGGNGAAPGTGSNGTANTGGGAGGGGGGGATGGNGGSGIVVISYPDIYQAAASTTGSPTVSTTGSGSISFNGSNQYLLYNAQSGFAFGTGNFTIEFFVRFVDVNGGFPIDFRPSGGSSDAPVIYISSSTLRYYVATDRITSGTLSAGVWYHVAVARSGTSTKMFIDGTQVGSTFTDNTNYTVGSSRPVIGSNGATLGNSLLNGYISNLRIVKGSALYTSNFSAPTAPLTAVTNTSFLLNAMSGAVTADSSANGIAPNAGSERVGWNQLSPFATGLGYKNRVYTWTSSGSITF